MTLKQRALDEIRGGRLEAALQLLSEARADDPQDPELWFYLGAVHGSLGNARGAEESFREAIALRPDFVQARLNLGKALKDQGHLDDAENAYRAVVELAPQHAPAWSALAQLLAQQGKLEEASQVARQGLELAPNASEAHVTLGSICLARKEVAAAISLFTEALKRAPNSVSALVNLGLAHKAAGQLSDAKSNLNRALAIDSNLPEAHYTLGVIYLQERLMDQAEFAFIKALAREPGPVHAFEQLGALLRHKNKREEALQLYRRFAAQYPLHPDAKFFLSMLESGNDPGRIPVEMLAYRYQTDEVASSFDHGMTQRLEYIVPGRLEEHLVRLLGDGGAGKDALDLGCGTGLYGPIIKRWFSRLVGVDLSPAMLKEAQRKNVYDELVAGELIEILDATTQSYDFVIAMDVLVFFGDLGAIFERVKRVLRPGGLFIFDLEKGDEAQPWQLHIFGNYAHSRHYIAELAELYGFRQLLCEELKIRMEGSMHIDGFLVIFQH